MDNFTNNQVFSHDLPKWQDVEFQKISPKYRIVVAISFLIAMAIFTLVFLGFMFINEDQWTNSLCYIFIGILFFLSFLLIINIWSIQYWGYALREQDVLYRAGIFTKKLKIIPLKNVQHVNVKEGFLSRMFGLSSIELHTAGVGVGVVIPGIEIEIVREIQEYVSEKISQKSTH